MFGGILPLTDYQWKLGDWVWYEAPVRIYQRGGRLIKNTSVAVGPYQNVDKLSLQLISIRASYVPGTLLWVHKSCLTAYDDIAAVLASPARWLEPFGGFRTFDGLEIGEVTLGDEEAEIEQELQHEASLGEGGP